MTKVEDEQLGAFDGTYSAKDMSVLEGLEPVRKRPGMFIGSTGSSGLHHLVWEVVDNSVDEAMAGYCTRIDVTLLADGGCRVVDNGRGIPTDVNPQYKLSGVEIALTRLHGGGKFGGSGYKVSGGLHGVGVSVVNALSSRLIVEVDYNGQRHRMEFVNGGKPLGKLEALGPSPRNRRGTSVTFWPDASILEDVVFVARTVLERLQVYAFLNAGLEIGFRDEREGGGPRSPTPTKVGSLISSSTSTRRRILSSRRSPTSRFPRTMPRSRSRCSGTPPITRASTALPMGSPLSRVVPMSRD